MYIVRYHGHPLELSGDRLGRQQFLFYFLRGFDFFVLLDWRHAYFITQGYGGDDQRNFLSPGVTVNKSCDLCSAKKRKCDGGHPCRCVCVFLLGVGMYG